jgi:hypothetical protein
MGLYRRLYPTVEAQVLALDTFHGSYVRDLFIEFAAGRFSVDDRADRLIQELVEEGAVETLEKCPTHSQAAFAGLQYSQNGYDRTGWAAGTREHFRYRVVARKT